jgi:hypothetical protein
MSTDPYPEHTKMQAVADHSQAIGEFLENSGWALAEWACIHCGAALSGPRRDPDLPRDGDCCNNPVLRLLEVGWPLQRVLAQYFKIDLDRLEQEKRAMLDALREANRGQLVLRTRFQNEVHVQVEP